jgi:uncharacterized protein (TIGR00255 family)
MIHSMTGFGRGHALSDTWRAQVDVRAVNHRYFDLQIRAPKNLAPLEPEMRKWMQGQFTRGHLEIFVVVQRVAGAGSQVLVNLELADTYLRELVRLKEHLRLPQEPTLDMVARLPGVLEPAENEEEELTELRPLSRQALAAAAKQLREMQAAEGALLAEDLRAGLNRLGELLVELKQEAPAAQNELAARLRDRVANWAGETELDEARLLQETAILLSRMDVHEELTRLAAHLDRFNEYLTAGGAIGKQLDFLTQEIHREITTCGNKVQGMNISRLVVEMKATTEKIREQVQNVE